MNKSVYIGIYKEIDSNGKAHSVQIHDNANSMPLDVETYIERGIKPNLEDLPTKKEYEDKK